MLWVQSVLNEEDEPIPGQSNYSPARSLTAKNLMEQASSTYGDGSRVAVNLVRDYVRAGRLLAEQQVVGAAPSASIVDTFKSSKSNGLLGLGFPLEGSTARRNFVQTLYDEQRVKHASFAIIGPRNDPKLAAQIDKKAVLLPRGVFVVGSVDPKYYTGSIAWCPQQLVTDRLIVALDEIKINGQTAFTKVIRFPTTMPYN
jgi:Eukaryotic aspartyl protease